MWNQNFLWTAPSYFASASGAAALNGIYRTYGFNAILLLMPLFYIIYHSYRLYTEKVHQEKAHLTELYELNHSVIASHLLSLPIGGITVNSPTGPAWEFLVLFLVVIIGPPLLERALLPGIIGLLVGGFLIGPNGLEVIGAGNTAVPELGQLGLLYLMFVAGVELDLGIVRIHRRAVLLFGVLAFSVPMVLGSVVGFALHWSAPAAFLLGSLMASHTLLVYPAVSHRLPGAIRIPPEPIIRGLQAARPAAEIARYLESLPPDREIIAYCT